MELNETSHVDDVTRNSTESRERVLDDGGTPASRERFLYPLIVKSIAREHAAVQGVSSFSLLSTHVATISTKSAILPLIFF